jgi:hypothetical protein
MILTASRDYWERQATDTSQIQASLSEPDGAGMKVRIIGPGFHGSVTCRGGAIRQSPFWARLCILRERQADVPDSVTAFSLAGE